MKKRNILYMRIDPVLKTDAAAMAYVQELSLAGFVRLAIKEKLKRDRRKKQ